MVEPGDPVATEPLSETEGPFDAFLSYSSRPDARLARRLESFLETFHQQVHEEELDLEPLKICLDGSDFDLGESVPPLEGESPVQAVLRKYLSRSRALIVLCSSGSSVSANVTWEIEWFLRNRPRSKIFLVVTDGRDPLGDPNSVFPAPIIERGLHTRIWYDFRGAERKRRRDAPEARNFEEERLQLAANLLGRSLDEISPGWFRQKRAESRTRARIFLATAVVMTILAAVAWWQSIVANRREMESNSRLLATQSAEFARREEIEASLLSAAHGIILTPSPLSRSSLAKSLQALPDRLLRTFHFVDALAPLPDGESFLIARQGAIQLIGARSLEVLATATPAAQTIIDLKVAPGGKGFLVEGLDAMTVWTIDRTETSGPRLVSGRTFSSRSLAWDSSGHFLLDGDATSGNPRIVAPFDRSFVSPSVGDSSSPQLATWMPGIPGTAIFPIEERLWTVEAPTGKRSPLPAMAVGETGNLLPSPDSRFVLARRENTGPLLLEIRTGRIQEIEEAPGPKTFLWRPAPFPEFICYDDEEPEFTSWRLREDEWQSSRHRIGVSELRATWSPSGNFLAWTSEYDGDVRLWDPASRKIIATVSTDAADPVIRWSEDETGFLSRSMGSRIIEGWRFDPERERCDRAWRILDYDSLRVVAGVTSSNESAWEQSWWIAGGERILTLGEDSAAKVWSARGQPAAGMTLSPRFSGTAEDLGAAVNEAGTEAILWSQGEAGELELWSLEDGSRLPLDLAGVGALPPPHEIEWLSGGRQVLVSTWNDGSFLLDLSEPKIEPIELGDGNSEIRLSPDRSRFVAMEPGGEAVSVNTFASKERRSLPGITGRVDLDRLFWRPDGSGFLLRTEEKAEIWKLEPSPSAIPVELPRVAPSGELRGANAIEDLVTGGETGWSPDGAFLALIEDNAVQVFNGVTGKPASDPVDTGLARCQLRWSPDGRWLSVYGHQRVHLFDRRKDWKRTELPESGFVQGTLAQIDCYWSPDSSRLAMASSGGPLVEVLDISCLDSTALKTTANEVDQIHWSSDSRYLLCEESDKGFTLVDARSAEILMHSEDRFLTWVPSPHGQAPSWLSALADGSVRLECYAPQAWMEKVSSAVHRNLTTDEWARIFGEGKEREPTFPQLP